MKFEDVRSSVDSLSWKFLDLYPTECRQLDQIDKVLPISMGDLTSQITEVHISTLQPSNPAISTPRESPEILFDASNVCSSSLLAVYKNRKYHIITSRSRSFCFFKIGICTRKKNIFSFFSRPQLILKKIKEFKTGRL